VDRRDHIQATAKDTVVRWVVYPDSIHGFNHGEFGDVGHDIHIRQVDDVLKTPELEQISEGTDHNEVQHSQQLLFSG
jgi:hypothetical protein